MELYNINQMNIKEHLPACPGSTEFLLSAGKSFMPFSPVESKHNINLSMLASW